MVPEVGSYTIVVSGHVPQIKGWRVRGRRCPPNGPYVHLLVYQVNVNFVSVNESMFPRQHLRPPSAKITEPLNQRCRPPTILCGVPCCPNTLAVGVVNRPAPKVVAPPKSDATATVAAAGETAQGEACTTLQEATDTAAGRPHQQQRESQEASS